MIYLGDFMLIAVCVVVVSVAVTLTLKPLYRPRRYVFDEPSTADHRSLTDLEASVVELSPGEWWYTDGELCDSR